MKKIIIIIALALSINAFGQSPNWQWAKNAGGSGSDFGHGTTTDANGDVFVTGSFSSPSITFGSTTLTNASTSGNISDMYIVKYNASGTVLWAISAGGPNDDEGDAITTDGSGNVIVTGWFYSSNISFGTITLATTGPGAMFIAKFDTNGNIIWAKCATGNVDAYGYGITTDVNNNIFVTGSFSSSSLLIGSFYLNNNGAYDIFIAKYDSSGNVLWAKLGGGNDYDEAYGIAADISGNVYITGFFESTSIVFDSITLTNTSAGSMFIVKYDTNGNVIWAKNSGGISQASAIVTDTSGIYVTGSFDSPTIVFGSYNLINSGDLSTFIVKYNSSGNVLWAKNFSGHSEGTSIAADASGIYLLGIFSDTTFIIGSNTVINTDNTGAWTDIYIAKYNSNGNVIWAKSVGTDSADWGNSISTNGSDIYLTGYFHNSSIAFGATTLTGFGSQDMYLAKLNSTTGVDEMELPSSFVIAPNPFTSQTNIRFSSEQKNNTIKIIDILGREIETIIFTGKQFTLEKGNLSEGIYLLQTMDEKQIISSKKIIVQ